MPLTSDFWETIKRRADRDPAFRIGIFEDACEILCTGEVAEALSLMRRYVNATIGFTAFSERTGLPAKSLMRMMSPGGNPRADSLAAILGVLHAETEADRARVRKAAKAPRMRAAALSRGGGKRAGG